MDVKALIAEARRLAENARDASSRRDGDGDWNLYRQFIAKSGGPERLLAILDSLEAVSARPLVADREAVIGGLLGSLPQITPKHTQDAVDDLFASGVVQSKGDAQAEALEEAARKWLQGGWADTPRRADRVADRMAASQFAGDWMKARAAAYRTPASLNSEEGDQ